MRMRERDKDSSVGGGDICTQWCILRLQGEISEKKNKSSPAQKGEIPE